MPVATNLHEIPGKVPSLMDRRPVPNLILNYFDQIVAHTEETLQKRSLGRFNPSLAIEAINAHEGKTVIGVDIGGDKIAAVRYTVRNGVLKPDKKNPEPIKSKKEGENYLQFLQRVAAFAEKTNTPIGISCAGMIEGTQLKKSPNIKKFVQALADTSNSDFRQLSQLIKAVNNDAVAALIPAIIHARKEGHLPEDGEGTLYAMEPGHVELVHPMQLPIRILGQKAPDELCDMNSGQVVCAESVVGGVAGIEGKWYKTTGQRLSAREIGKLCDQGHPFAQQLYDNSATILSAGILGMGNVLNLFGDNNSSGVLLPIIGGGYGGAGFVMPDAQGKGVSVAFHGSINKQPHYMDRVALMLKGAGVQPNRFFTGDISSINAGAEGAAIAALMALAA